MHKNVIHLFLIGVIVTFSSCVKTTNNQSVQLISSDEANALLAIEEVQLIDVRSATEFSLGHIPNSQNIDVLSPSFDDDIKLLDKSKPVMVYCKSGNRSAKCSKKLQAAGFVKIYDLEGGISKWKHQGYDIKVKS
jgi:rhodanese-related sulfurtransferase